MCLHGDGAAALIQGVLELGLAAGVGVGAGFAAGRGVGVGVAFGAGDVGVFSGVAGG